MYFLIIHVVYEATRLLHESRASEVPAKRYPCAVAMPQIYPQTQVYNKVNLFTSPQASPLSLPSGNDFDLPVVSSLSKTSSEPPEVEEDEDEAGDCDFSSAPSFA